MGESNPISDHDMVDRMRRGDESGLDALLDVHGPYVARAVTVSLRILATDDALWDAIQDSALKMFGLAHRLDPDRGLRGYFYTLARRECVRIRRARGDQPWLLGEDAEAVADFVEDERGDPESSGFGAALLSFLGDLPDKQREILMLDFAYGYTLSAREVARRTGVKLGSVYTLRNRAKSALKDFLDEWGVEVDE